MRFGPGLLPDGSTLFRLWGPSASRVDLSLYPGSGERVIPMEAVGGGWFEARVEGVRPGDRYRFLLQDGSPVPDPASRRQIEDVHDPSGVEAPGAFSWKSDGWGGRPWEETVLYELHVGTFTEQGGFEGVCSRLDHLASLGVTAVELMPVSDFPGDRNWGYDGVLPFAPDGTYGTPDGLKRLVDEAHRRDLMVFLDVVYNHFGPEGNYLHLYAKSFFHPERTTPWGAAINLDAPGSREVRNYFIENALYWLEEFRMDGLRLDAVHALRDDSNPSFLDELARAVHAGPGADRHVHLVLENDSNQADWLRRTDAGAVRRYVAQWNDDVHHAFHCLLTGESSGYYADYADAPARHLARALAEGFAYQGDVSRYRGGRRRGQASRHLPPTAFVNFLQNHDQVGNRAFGERLTELTEQHRLRAAVAVLLLSPSPPLLFMGEEFGSRRPFPFFCDFGPELAHAVSEGRRREFARFDAFRDPKVRERIPDPGDPLTFAGAELDWSVLEREPHGAWLGYYRSLLDLRRREIVPRLADCRGGASSWMLLADNALRVEWTLGDASSLVVVANLGDETARGVRAERGRLLFAVEMGATLDGLGDRLGPWTAAWFLDDRSVR